MLSADVKYCCALCAPSHPRLCLWLPRWPAREPSSQSLGSRRRSAARPGPSTVTGVTRPTMPKSMNPTRPLGLPLLVLKHQKVAGMPAALCSVLDIWSTLGTSHEISKQYGLMALGIQGVGSWWDSGRTSHTSSCCVGINLNWLKEVEQALPVSMVRTCLRGTFGRPARCQTRC